MLVIKIRDKPSVLGQSVRPDSLLFLVGLGVREYLDEGGACESTLISSRLRLSCSNPACLNSGNVVGFIFIPCRLRLSRLNPVCLDPCSASRPTFTSNELGHLAQTQHSLENFLGIPCGYFNILY
jgi:hypothetical protein